MNHIIEELGQRPGSLTLCYFKNHSNLTSVKFEKGPVGNLLRVLEGMRFSGAETKWKMSM